jgi:hypothetical protein
LNGIRNWVAVSICVALLASVGGTACARTYWAYYDCAPGVSTVVVLTNASEFALEDAVAVRLYDANGLPILESVHGLAAYESTTVFLNGLLAETDESTWGLAEIESRLLLQIGVWVGAEDDWLFVENYGELAVNTGGLSVEAYWYGLNYANTQNRRTTVTILNPSDSLVSGSLYMYDAYGTLQYQRFFQLPPRQPTYIDLETVSPIGDDVWGLVDIETEGPALIVCGYFDAEGYLIDVDVVDRPYYLEIIEQE